MEPEELGYTAEHEWVRSHGDGTVTFGITHFAQDALGDIVYVSLPSTGDALAAGATCGEVESTKSVSEIYAPVDGIIVHKNDVVETSPETINSDPYGAGWMADIEVIGGAIHAQEHLMDAAAYRAYINEA